MGRKKMISYALFLSITEKDEMRNIIIAKRTKIDRKDWTGGRLYKDGKNAILNI